MVLVSVCVILDGGSDGMGATRRLYMKRQG